MVPILFHYKHPGNRNNHTEAEIQEEFSFLLNIRITMGLSQRALVNGLEEHDIYCCVTIINKQLIQNWHGPGESDCLIKMFWVVVQLIH